MVLLGELMHGVLYLVYTYKWEEIFVVGGFIGEAWRLIHSGAYIQGYINEIRCFGRAKSNQVKYVNK